MAENQNTKDATTEAETFGVSGLIDEIEAATGKVYQPATIRILLRKLAADGVVEKTGGRWTFSADDPAVDAVIDAVKAGKAEKEPKEEAEKPAKKAPAKKSTKKAPAKKAEPVEEDADDLEVDLDEL